MNEAWAAADSVLAAKGRSFHWARRLLGPVHARRATRLYGFCRMVDDLADLTPTSRDALLALDTVRTDIVDGVSPNPVTGDMLALMAECGIEQSHILELICGVTGDLKAVRLQTMDELLHYCYQVAGVVGLMMCRVLDVTDPAAHAHAVALGMAMQLTNICRDVAEDAAGGRVYLPSSIIGALDSAALAHPTEEQKPVIIEAVAKLLVLAERHYRFGEAGLPYLPVRARAGILVAARVYRAIGLALSDRGLATWGGRVFVTGYDKAVITARALTGTMLSRAFWRTPKSPANAPFSLGLGGRVSLAGQGAPNGR